MKTIGKTLVGTVATLAMAAKKAVRSAQLVRP